MPRKPLRYAGERYFMGIGPKCQGDLKDIVTLFGEIHVRRAYYLCGRESCSYPVCPLDQRLGLDGDSFLPRVQQVVVWLTSLDPYMVIDGKDSYRILKAHGLVEEALDLSATQQAHRKHFRGRLRRSDWQWSRIDWTGCRLPGVLPETCSWHRERRRQDSTRSAPPGVASSPTVGIPFTTVSDAVNRTVENGLAGLLISNVVQMCYVTGQGNDLQLQQTFSGILVRYGDKHLIVTADHCLADRDSLLTKGTRGPFVLRTGNTVILDMAGNQDATILCFCQSQNPAVDVAWMEIRPDEYLRTNHFFVEQSRLGLPPKPGYFVLTGYPSSGTRQEEVFRSYRAFMRMQGIRRDVHFLQVGALREDVSHRWFNYPEEGTPVFGRDEPGYPDPPGMSGGALWWVEQKPTSDLTSNSLFPEGDWRLVGIQSTWHPGERWVKVVKVTELTQMLES